MQFLDGELPESSFPAYEKFDFAEFESKLTGAPDCTAKKVFLKAIELADRYHEDPKQVCHQTIKALYDVAKTLERKDGEPFGDWRQWQAAKLPKSTNAALDKVYKNHWNGLSANSQNRRSFLAGIAGGAGTVVLHGFTGYAASQLAKKKDVPNEFALNIINSAPIALTSAISDMAVGTAMGFQAPLSFAIITVLCGDALGCSLMGAELTNSHGRRQVWEDLSSIFDQFSKVRNKTPSK